MSKLQHLDFVKLLVCHIEEERMLIYEYVPNKCLDYFIFDQKRSAFVDPSFQLNAFHTRWQARFLIWKIDFIWLKIDLESPLIFVLFLKGKQNKKENPKCDSLFWKRWSTKNRIGFGGQVTCREGTVKTVAPL